MLSYIVKWNSNVVSANMSPHVYKILDMYERVNISITPPEKRKIAFISIWICQLWRVCLSFWDSWKPFLPETNKVDISLHLFLRNCDGVQITRNQRCDTSVLWRFTDKNMVICFVCSSQLFFKEDQFKKLIPLFDHNPFGHSNLISVFI